MVKPVRSMMSFPARPQMRTSLTPDNEWEVPLTTRLLPLAVTTSAPLPPPTRRMPPTVLTPV